MPDDITPRRSDDNPDMFTASLLRRATVPLQCFGTAGDHALGRAPGYFRLLGLLEIVQVRLGASLL
jgi:hypothetical protein